MSSPYRLDVAAWSGLLDERLHYWHDVRQLMYRLRSLRFRILQKFFNQPENRLVVFRLIDNLNHVPDAQRAVVGVALFHQQVSVQPSREFRGRHIERRGHIIYPAAMLQDGGRNAVLQRPILSRQAGREYQRELSGCSHV
jgi:hypothetical protein